MEDQGESPFIRFRRRAQLVKNIIKVCQACKSLQSKKLKNEKWYALVDNIIAEAELQHKRRQDRAFIAVVRDDRNQLVKLTFDVDEYSRGYMSESLLTPEIKEILMKISQMRTDEDINKLLRCLRMILHDFSQYPLDIQKQLCRHFFLDRYDANRVIIQRGLPPDGLYFVLSGILLEKKDDSRAPAEILTGERFGEDDIVNGVYRQSIIVTKTHTELAGLHSQDFKRIFQMSQDCYDASNLDICRLDLVLQHFPMTRFRDNPGMWNVWKYRNGKLIVEDSNEVKWIYVIKSGEAQVLKHLRPGRINIRATRNRIQAMLDRESPHKQQIRLLGFTGNEDACKSYYTPSHYKPVTRPIQRSAPPGRRGLGLANQSVSTCSIAQHSYQQRPHTVGVQRSRRRNLPALTCVSQTAIRDLDKRNYTETANRIGIHNIHGQNPEETSAESPYICTPLVTNSWVAETEDGELLRPSQASRFLRSRQKTPRPTEGTTDPNTVIPPFVYVETLHRGQTFGLRTCLEPDEWGPTVSLVSGGCEMIQINREFFIKHSDEALFSLIRLQTKMFPTQSELIDRLDANVQWSQYKQNVMQEYFDKAKL